MQEELDRLADEVRLTFHVLAEFANRVGDGRLDAPSRAVLEILMAHDPMTVPMIARERGVSRQHIQTIINELVGRELVEAIPNPAHRRSPLFVPTEWGADLLSAVLGDERRVLEPAFEGFSTRRLLQVSRTLGDVREILGGVAERP